jgi:3'-5' exoribonuclease
MKLNTINQGDAVEGIYTLRRFAVREARNGKYFADVIVGDLTGEIPAKYGILTSRCSKNSKPAVLPESPASAKYNNGRLQLRINDIKNATPTQEELKDLIEAAPYPPDKMYAKIIEIIDGIKNPDIRTLTKTYLERNKQQLMYYPAAKSFHHAVRSGLIYHTYSMFRCALPLLDIYDFLNKDLVYAGIALHDIGKIKEIISDENGIASQYSREGKLLGHITETVTDIGILAEELHTDKEVTMLLQHMVLAHHFSPEYGSPKPPMFAEAEKLHYLDVLDSRMNQMQKTLNLTQPGEFAENVWILDNRTIYNHALDKEKNQ